MTAPGTPSKTPPKTPRPTPVPRVRSALLDGLAAADVTSFWDGVGARQPVVEPALESAGGAGQVVVTFCWRSDDAAEVLLFANRLTDETSLADTVLERLPGSDLWHASFLMEADWRASYCFLVRDPGEEAPWLVDGHVAIRAVLDRGLPDPRNPARCRNRAGVPQSVVALPAADPQPWLEHRPTVARGTVTEHVLDEGLDGGRVVWWWDPPGVAEDAELPLVVALDGEVWTSSQSLPTTMDNLLADAAIPPVRVVLPSSGGRDSRWAEMGSTGGAVDHLVSTLLPWAEARGGVRRGGAVIVGQSLGGLTALRAGLLHPEEFSTVVTQSASVWQSDLSEEVALATAAPALSGGPLRVHLAHGSQEWVLAPGHLDLAQRLRTAGVTVEETVVNGGHDYAWWRGTLAEGLRWALETVTIQTAPDHA